MKITYYDILGIPETATPKEIKDAYRELSKTHHPDKGGDREEFETIKKAYECLSDKNKRSQYDLYGGDDMESQEIIRCAVTIFKTAVEQGISSLTLNILHVHENGTENLNRQKKNAESEVKKIEKVLAKIKGFPKDDFLKRIMLQEIAGHEQQIERIDHGLNVSDIAFKLLKEYTFEDSREIGDGEESAMESMLRRSMGGSPFDGLKWTL